MSHFCHNLDNETGKYKSNIFINEWKKMKIKIQKIETYTITHSTEEFEFDMNEFRHCTPAFIGDTHKDFMDYITNDIENIKDYIDDNNDVLNTSTIKSLYLLDVDPMFNIIEDSRNDYEDSWFTMKPSPLIEKKVKSVQVEKIVK